MKVCLSEKCPSQYTDCQKKNGCEKSIIKCAGNDQCDVKVNTDCWTKCLGGYLKALSYLSILTCAADNCLTGVEKEIGFEDIGRAID